MINAISKAIAQLGDRPIQKVILLTLISGFIVFVVLWSVVGFSLANTNIFAIGWLETVVDFMGGLATLIITWMLFPGIISAVMALFLETIARAVEAKHYPHLAPAEGVRVGESIFAAVRFVAVLVVLNIFLLMFLIFPPIFPFVFYGVNGYLLGREYFEMVALRRMNTHDARALRKQNKNRVLVFGIVIAFLLSIPLVNLLVPIVATAAMLHLFEKWRH